MTFQSRWHFKTMNFLSYRGCSKQKCFGMGVLVRLLLGWGEAMKFAVPTKVALPVKRISKVFCKALCDSQPNSDTHPQSRYGDMVVLVWTMLHPTRDFRWLDPLP